MRNSGRECGLCVRWRHLFVRSGRGGVSFFKDISTRDTVLRYLLPMYFGRDTKSLWAAVFTFNPYLLISINELMISIIHLLISINELLISINDLLISINELLISINTSSSTVFIDINNSFIDINKGIIDINNSFIDINKYGWRCHIY